MIETWERHQTDIRHVLDTRLYLGKDAIRLANVQQTRHRHLWQGILQRRPVPLGRRQRLKVVGEELCLFLLRQRREADPQPSQRSPLPPSGSSALQLSDSRRCRRDITASHASSRETSCVPVSRSIVPAVTYVAGRAAPIIAVLDPTLVLAGEACAHAVSLGAESDRSRARSPRSPSGP